MSQRAADFAGVFPPIATAFDADGSIDFKAQAANLERWERAALAGYVVGGSNGEYVSMSTTERIELVKFVRGRIAPERLVIAGSGMHSTAAAIELTQAMAEAGADAVLVVTPAYYKSKMDHRTLVSFFSTLADRSPVPVLLYNVPANTGIDMAVDTIVELSQHDNIAGIKDSSGSVAKMGEVCARARAGFQVLAGSASSLLGALAMGAVGTVPALSNIAPGQVHDIWALARAGDFAAARTVQLPLIAVNQAVTARFGVPGLKAAMDLTGYHGGPTRPPLLPLTAPEREQLQSILAAANLI